MRKNIYFVFLIVLTTKFATAQYILAGQHTTNNYFYDVVPDSTMNSSTSFSNVYIPVFPIDLNGDGITDFKLKAYKGPGQGSLYRYSYITMSNNNQIVSLGNASCSYSNCMVQPPNGTFSGLISDVFNPFDTIKSNLNWVNDSISMSKCYCCVLSDFSSTTDNFLGARVYTCTDTIYGWIKVNADCVGFTIKEFACNSLATGIKENIINPLITIYPNPANDYFIVNSANNTGLTLTDASGRLIMKKELKSASEKINISQFAKGIYFIEVKEGSKAIYRTKIVKE